MESLTLLQKLERSEHFVKLAKNSRYELEVRFLHAHAMLETSDYKNSSVEFFAIAQDAKDTDVDMYVKCMSEYYQYGYTVDSYDADEAVAFLEKYGASVPKLNLRTQIKFYESLATVNGRMYRCEKVYESIERLLKIWHSQTLDSNVESIILHDLLEYSGFLVMNKNPLLLKVLDVLVDFRGRMDNRFYMGFGQLLLSLRMSELALTALTSCLQDVYDKFGHDNLISMDTYNLLCQCFIQIGDQKSAKYCLKKVKYLRRLDKTHQMERNIEVLEAKVAEMKHLLDVRPNIRRIFPKKCSYLRCENKETDTREFKLCGSCYCAYYCSPKCQKKHWKEHKKICKEVV